MNQNSSRPARKRSIAWLYYAVLAAVCAVFGIHQDANLLIPAGVCAAYLAYLFCGGRFVLWIW